MFIIKVLIFFFIYINITYANNLSNYEKESKLAIKALASNLKKSLKVVLIESGPVAAVEYCNIAALDITDEISTDKNVLIKRTSLKLRNKNNFPTTWEIKVLKDFKMEWVPAPTPINENRRAKAVEKTGIIGTDQIYLFDIYLEIAKDISGYDAGSFSLYDSKNQCMISEIGKPGEREIHRKADKAASICSYVLLEKNPLLIFELRVAIFIPLDLTCTFVASAIKKT